MATRATVTRPFLHVVAGSLVIIPVLCVALIGHRVNSEPQSPDLQFTILHTNDLHSHDEPFTEFGKSIGGMARIGHLIRSIRKQEPNTLVVDAGDIFQGTPFFSKYHGAVEVHLLNEIGYDLFTIGNHEFDDGPENLAEQLKQAKFQIISANMDCSKFPPLEELVKNSVVKEINGQKIGFIGCVTPDLETLVLNRGEVKLKQKGADWYQPIKDEVEKLKKEGINKIIILSHSGQDREKELAKNIPDIDAVIGGHSHTRMDHPEIFEHPGVGTTVVVQTGSYGRALGKLHLAFDKDGKLVFPETTYHLINITDKIYEDADLKKYIDEKGQPLLALKKDVLGEAETDFDNKWLTMPWDSPLGDMVTDAIYQAAKPFGATIAFENRGGIRARIDKGPISEETVQEMLPFDNRLTIGTINGDTLLKTVEHSVQTAGGGKFLDVHGLKIAYDSKGDPGHRIIFALSEEKPGAEKGGDEKWVPIDPAKKYRIAINSYTFSGGEGYDFKSAENVKNMPDKMSDVFRAYLKIQPNNHASAPSRIVPVVATLARPEKNGTAIKLHVHADFPCAKAYLITGDGLGVDSVKITTHTEHNVPVPLSHAKIIRTEELDGKTDVDLAPPEGNDIRLSSETKGSKKQLVTVIVEPMKASAGKIQVSAPVDLNALSN
jgi:5'-nucleotidase / UDP-sugar diphosphatase